MKRTQSRCYRAILAALAVSLLLPQVAAAAFVKLSGTMPAFGDVDDFQISPDGQYVVYLADHETDGAFELYSVPIAGGTPVLLNEPLVVSFGGFTFRISPDSSRVVYCAHLGTGGVSELYSVPIAGPASAGVKLSGTMPAFGDVTDFQISPDGQYVVYLADQETDGAFEMYSVPIAGPASAGVKLNGTLAAGGDVHFYFQVSPDGQHVVYPADQDTDEVWELYSVPIAGPAGAGVKLNGPLVAGGDLSFRFQVSPDSSRVVYRADQDTDEVFELYSVPIAGPAGDGVKLSGTLPAFGDVDTWFQVSADGSYVVYLADEHDEIWELYSVPIAGPASAGVKLNGTLAAGGDVMDWFEVSPDGQRVVYYADEDTDGVWELYSVPIAGPASAGVKLNGPLVAGGGVWEFRVSPDSSRVAYQADQDTAGAGDLYSVPIAGPASDGAKLNGPLVAGGNVHDFQFAPDSSRVVYKADQDTAGVQELYVADDGQTRVAFGAATATAGEHAGSTLLAVELSAAAVLPVTVDYAVTGGTATGGGVDYTLAAGSLTFDPGETAQAITIPVVNDGLVEGSETVVVTLSNPGNARLGTPATATLTIQDDVYTICLPAVVRNRQ